MVYCSDISGAFDRVRAEKLLCKLWKKGLHPKILQILESWLRIRRANVVVDGFAVPNPSFLKIKR